ncbi:unnamed protein product [Didymodactylos carnosus]|uniref:Uncharacterized protein n=1 Tax=Didymodactylos carnosus TaxID=1234261 RepID=A0A815XY63_9BILA|nr:unnamed protein product [Didymodactylos carnosus]CAF4424882.1 unnamed protein product [Didymodactylos carnosus]
MHERTLIEFEQDTHLTDEAYSVCQTNGVVSSTATSKIDPTWQACCGISPTINNFKFSKTFLPYKRVKRVSHGTPTKPGDWPCLFLEVAV